MFRWSAIWGWRINPGTNNYPTSTHPEKTTMAYETWVDVAIERASPNPDDPGRAVVTKMD